MRFTRNTLPVLIAILLLNCGGDKEKKEEIRRPVKYHVVGTSESQKIRTFSGLAKAGNEIELSFRGSGVITKVNVTKGQKVKKGTLIAKLDNIEANLDYEKSVSSLNGAESAMNTAKAELDRIKALYQKSSVSLSDYESAKNSYQNALSQFESAKRNKSIQQTQISYGFIYAPSDGIIADTNGKVNERITGGHVFAILNAGDQMKIEVGLPESVINKVVMEMEVDISFAALEGKNFEGHVVEISPTIGENSATFPIDVVVTEASGDIKPGMAATITFNFSNSETVPDNSLIVPIKAVGEDAEGNFVFVIESEDDETGTAKKQVIEIGELTADGFKILSGLSEGQKVVTAGLQTLIDGQKVRL